MAVYISEFNVYTANSGDFTEFAADQGTDVSGYSFFVYNSDGTVKSGPFSLGSSVANESGKDIYVIDEDSSGLNISTGDSIALIDNTGGVVQFLGMSNSSTTASNGPAAGETSTPPPTQSTTQSVQSDDGGQTYYAQDNENKGTIPCFAEGTLIETSKGVIPIEDITVGNKLMSISGERHRVMWVCRTPADVSSFLTSGYPVRIAKGALGYGKPNQDLTVSPQHRILVGESGQLQGTFDQAALVPAKSLIGMPGITEATDCTGLTWYHLACETHQIVHAHGCAAETLLLGLMVLNATRRRTKYHIKSLFPEVIRTDIPLNGPTIRDCWTVQQTKQALDCPLSELR